MPARPHPDLSRPEPFRPDADLLDQHLLDPVVADALVAQADLGADDVVLDVGAGTGSLTAAILRRRPRGVIAVEPDPRCHPWLTRLAGVDLRPLLIQALDAAELAQVTMIIANPPFSVLQHVTALAQDLPRLRAAHLCVGERWAAAATATPDDDHFSIISLAVSACFEPTVLAAVPGSAFTPPITGPAVWLRLLPRADRDPVIMLLVDAIRHRGGLRLKEFLRAPRLLSTGSRLRALRADPALRRLQQRRLAALTRAELAEVVRRLNVRLDP